MKREKKRLTEVKNTPTEVVSLLVNTNTKLVWKEKL